jgi:aldose 1-epimerase
LPLGGTDGGACLVRLPVQKRWELADMLPTGRQLTLENAERLAAGLPFAEMKFDDLFTGLEFEDGWCRPSIHDPGSDATVTVAFDSAFRECVVYTPPHREAICIEPYTCVAGAFNLDPSLDTGLRILPPGGSFTAHVEFRVS